MYNITVPSALIFIIFLSIAVYAQDKQVDYPDGYRSWDHVKTMIILPGHALEDPFKGIHHIYANDKAINGYKTGSFENGSVIVFDLLDYTEADNTIQEGNRKLIGVMVKDSEKFSGTGGWGYEGFGGDSQTDRLANDGGVACFNCHLSQKDSDFVFSKYRK